MTFKHVDCNIRVHFYLSCGDLVEWNTPKVGDIKKSFFVCYVAVERLIDHLFIKGN